MRLFIFLFMGTTVFAKPVDVRIPPGSSTKTIAHILSQHDLIRSERLFEWRVRLSGDAASLRSGHFVLDTEMSHRLLVETLQEKHGPASLVKLTIIEGMHLDEIADAIGSPEFTTYVRTQAKADFVDKFPFLKEAPTNIEGYLPADTYLYAKGASMKMIVGLMLARLDSAYASLWRQHPSPKRSLHDTAIMASIIEKEAASTAEMPQISAVFHNRLNKRMLLGSCPTVAYALGEPRKRVLSYDDLKVRSPYNTYRNHGLPPTPIASFGLRAFKAALNPSPQFTALYFVANGDGTHTFTHSLREHLAAQKRILATQPPQSGYYFRH